MSAHNRMVRRGSPLHYDILRWVWRRVTQQRVADWCVEVTAPTTWTVEMTTPTTWTAEVTEVGCG